MTPLGWMTRCWCTPACLGGWVYLHLAGLDATGLFS